MNKKSDNALQKNFKGTASGGGKFSRRAAILAPVLLGLSSLPVLAYGQPYGANIRINSGGYHYINCFNSTGRRIAISFSYTKRYATGNTMRINGTAIVEAGHLNKAVEWCSIPAPAEELFDLKIHEIRNME